MTFRLRAALSDCLRPLSSGQSRVAPTCEATGAPWLFDRRTVLGASMLVLAGCTRQTAAPLGAFQGLMRDCGERLIQTNPERAAFLRLTDDGANLTRLTERGELAAELGRSEALRGLTQLLALNPQDLRPVDRTHYAILLEHFARLEPAVRLGMGRFSQTCGPAPYVLDPETAAVTALPAMFATIITVSDLADAEDYVVLLNRCAAVIDAEAQYARTQAAAGWVAPPEVLERVEAACALISALAPADGPFIRSVRDQLQAQGLLPPAAPAAPLPETADRAPTPAQTRAQALMAQAESLVARDIQPAVLRLAQVCAAQRGRAKPAASEFSRNWLSAGLRFVAGDAIDIEQLQAATRQQSKALVDQLDMNLRALGVIDGSVGLRLAQLGLDPRFDQAAAPPEMIRDAFNGHFAAASAQSAKWFNAGAFSELRVQIHDALGPLPGDGTFYRPAGPSAQDRASLSLDLARLRRKGRYELATLAFAQGIPGHHALSSLSKGAKTPVALQMIRFPAFVQGWCRYGEQLADEYGLNESDPWQRIGYLHAQLRGCALLLADLDLSWRMVPRAAALANLQDMAGMAPIDASRAVDAMLARPGAASAGEIGRSRIVAARDRARIGLGSAFDIRTFHGLILGGGELPLKVMDARIDTWINTARNSPK